VAKKPAKKPAAKKPAATPAKVGRPRKADTTRDVAPTGAARIRTIDTELLELASVDDDGSIGVKMRFASLQVQRWTLLSADPALNFREQGEASREAARWTNEFRQLSQRQADDLIRQLAERMREQESAADHLEKL
jgi:hypothetical protein